MLYGPTNEEMITEIFRAYVQVLQGPAAQSLSHPVEVPRRGAAALRRHALARVPDEGRLFLRPRPGRRARTPTTRCSSPICAPSRGWACTAIPMRADTGPIGGDSQPRVHHPRLDRRERGVLPQATISISRRRRRRHRFRRCRRPAGRSSTNGPRSTPRPPRCTTRPPSTRFREGRGSRRAASKSAISSISAPNIRKPMGAVVSGPDGKEHAVHMGSYGIGPTPPGRRDHRGQP